MKNLSKIALGPTSVPHAIGCALDVGPGTDSGSQVPRRSQVKTGCGTNANPLTQAGVGDPGPRSHFSSPVYEEEKKEEEKGYRGYRDRVGGSGTWDLGPPSSCQCGNCRRKRTGNPHWVDPYGPAAALRRELVRDPQGRVYRHEILERAGDPWISESAVMAAFRRVAPDAVPGGPRGGRYYEGWSWR
jgi:hypothetical protein